MSDTIKAIETRYKGYRFRSRLEARWAVFFDAMGIKWEYEKEGYDLGEAGWYLPDFWLYGVNYFVEIKPLEPEKGWLVKPTALAWEHGKPTMVIVGNPWIGDHHIEIFSDDPDHGMPFARTVAVYLGKCRRCDGISFVGDPDLHPECDVHVFGPLGHHTCDDSDKVPHIPDAAFHAARAARFEHGETPR